MRNGALGDFILTIPVFRALDKAYPSCQLNIVGSRSFSSIAPSWQNIVDANSRLWLDLYTDSKIPKELSDFFDSCRLVLVYGQNLGARFEHIKTKFGDRSLFVSPHPPENYSKHITDHLFDPIIDFWKLKATDRIPRLEKIATKTKKQSIIAHPGSSSPKKNWPLENFIEWARELKKNGIRVIFIQGPIEIEIGQTIPYDIKTIAPPNLRALADLLASTTLFVGNDSGPGHLAAAVGTPTLSLFGSTKPSLWAPRHPLNRVIIAPGNDLNNLSVGKVVSATLEYLSIINQDYP